MSVFNKLAGTTLAFVQLGGPAGPGFNRNTTALEARNAANSAFAVLRVATPVAANDATTKNYYDTGGSGSIVAPGAFVLDAGAALGLGSANATSIVEGNIANCASISNLVQTAGEWKVTVNATKVASLGKAATDFLAVGAVPATVGVLRLPNGANDVAGVVARDAGNTSDIGLMSLDSGNNLFFNTLGTLTSIQLGQTPTFFWNLLNGTIFGQANRPTDTAASALIVRAQSAFSGAVGSVDGGALTLESGDSVSNGVTGLRGACRLNLSHTLTQIGVEIAEVALGRRVTALNQFGTGVTSTTVPTGDRVVFVGVAATNPTSAPVGGFLIYAPAGTGIPAYFTSGGFQLTLPNQTSATIGAAGGAAALPALPLGYLALSINAGTSIKIPYYLP